MSQDEGLNVAQAKRAFVIEYAYPAGHPCLDRLGFVPVPPDGVTMENTMAHARLNIIAEHQIGQVIHTLARWAADVVAHTGEESLDDDIVEWEYQRFTENFTRFGMALITTALNEGLIQVQGIVVEED